MAGSHVTITIPGKWIVGVRIAGAALGFAAAFVVGPAVRWLLGLVNGAPAPLRFAAGLPLVWAIPVMTAAGLALGVWITYGWQVKRGVVSVLHDGVTVQRDGSRCFVAREQIREAFSDGRDLVLLDERTSELLRITTDETSRTKLRRVFQKLGYPWREDADPHDHHT